MITIFHYHIVLYVVLLLLFSTSVQNIDGNKNISLLTDPKQVLITSAYQMVLDR